MDSIPIIIISGFLGSGKTTLIKRIIDHNPNLKFGLVQNEFSSEMGIEKPIFIDNDTTIYELPSGCLCCSAKSELCIAIESLINIRNDLNYILIEASGVANVIELINLLWVDRNSYCKFHLQSVVTLVDGLNFIKTISDDVMSGIALSQISCVSNIIITKCRDKSVHLEDRIKGVNLNCTIYYADKLDVNEIIHWNDFTNQTIAINNCESYHLDKSMTKFIHVPVGSNEIISLNKINNMIALLLWSDSGKIYRCKGIFNAIDDNEAIDDEHLFSEWIYMLQGVGNTYEISPIGSSVYGHVNNMDNKFIFIGNKGEDELIERLQTCIINKK